jgi:hypothetical protein
MGFGFAAWTQLRSGRTLLEQSALQEGYDEHI